MASLQFSWDGEALRERAATWIIDLKEALNGDVNVIAEIEATLKEGCERWRDYANAEWREELNGLSERIKNLLLGGPGVAVLKCARNLTADQARLLQLILGCQFGVNVTQTAQGDDRPLFALRAEKDPTANDRYYGNGLKQDQIGFHTDGSGSTEREISLLSMLCIFEARFGGQSRIANSQRAFESLSESVQGILQQSFPMQDPYAPHSDRLLSRPVFRRGQSDAKFIKFSYHPHWIRAGIRSLRDITSAEAEAFCSLENALEEFSCEVNVMENDILFLNNRVIAHDRCQFWDDPASGRWLERFWGGKFV